MRVPRKTGTKPKLYGWRDRDFDSDLTHEGRIITIYHDRHWSPEDVASDIAYRDRFNTGLKDFREHHSCRPREHDAWKDADYGYDHAFGSKNAFKRAYRAAYYEEGYL